VALKVSVPVGSTALVYVPVHGFKNPVVAESGKVVWRSGALVERVEGVEGAWAEEGYVVFRVGSGTYAFETRPGE
jgi:hypothetical protein